MRVCVCACACVRTYTQSSNLTVVSEPGGLSGIGLGLGPGGQPIDATQLNRGGGAGMGNMGPGGTQLQLLKTH